MKIGTTVMIDDPESTYHESNGKIHSEVLNGFYKVQFEDGTSAWFIEDNLSPVECKYPGFEYVHDIKSFHSGGGCWIDIVVLKSGKCIGINDESIVLYDSIDDVYEDSNDDYSERTINY